MVLLCIINFKIDLSFKLTANFFGKIYHIYDYIKCKFLSSFSQNEVHKFVTKLNKKYICFYIGRFWDSGLHYKVFALPYK